MDALRRYLALCNDQRNNWLDGLVVCKHVTGAKTASDTAVCYLYTQGKASAVQAVEANAKAIDHILAVDMVRSDHKACVKLAQEMVQAGVDIAKVENARVRLLGRLGYVLASETDYTTIAQATGRQRINAITLAGTKRPVTVKRADGREGRAVVKTHQPTPYEIAIAAMVAAGNQSLELKAQITALKMIPRDVTNRLTDEQKAELTARFSNKGRAIVK